MRVENMVFVSGLPRAMTTLMCNVLANNDRIVGGETSPLLEYVYGARLNYSSVPEVKSALTADIMERSFLEFCSNGMVGYADEMIRQVKPEATIYLDKSRGWLAHYELLKKLEMGDGPKIIVMVRDIRCIVASMEKKWRANPHVMDGRENASTMDFTTIDSRVNHFLTDHPLGLSLNRLYDALMNGTLSKMHVVRAEDFCTNPEKTMRGVYNYLEEDYCPLDYGDIKQVTVENDRISDFGIYGDHKIKPCITPVENDFRQILGPTISQQIKANYPWFYNEFKYF